MTEGTEAKAGWWVAMGKTQSPPVAGWLNPGTAAMAGTRLDSACRNPRRRRAARDGYVKDRMGGPGQGPGPPNR